MPKDARVVRPVVTQVYKTIQDLIRSKTVGKKGLEEKDVYVTYEEFIYYFRDRYTSISEEEVRKALLNLELWGKIRVENNGWDLEIRLVEGT